MASPSHTRFRFLVKLALTVIFGGIVYRLAMVEVADSRLWRLEAQWSGGYWVGSYCKSEDALATIVYREGVEVERATVPQSILKRLVTEGRAEAMVAAPSAL